MSSVRILLLAVVCGLMSGSSGAAPLGVGGEAGEVDETNETGKLPDSTGSRLHPEYGFRGLIVSKLNDSISNLTSADLDGDGRGDLLLINNPKAQIEFLFQSKEGPVAEESDEELVNEFPDEVYFRRGSYPTEEKVTSVAVADLNGDGSADLVFLGESGHVTIAFRDPDGKYSRTARHKLEKHSNSWHAVRPKDLNGDGRTDLVVLGKEKTYLFLQDGEGRLEEPRKLPNGSQDARSFEVLDLNGDGYQDLLYIHYESEWPFRYRLGQADVGFGPELRSRFAKIRSYQIGDFDGRPGSELIAVRRESSRVALLRFSDAPSEEPDELPLSALRSVPFEEIKQAEQRQRIVVDLDGDGRQELLVAEPTAAQMVVHRGLLGGPSSGARKYPSFVGAQQPRMGDLDGDGKAELIVAAPDEGAVGVSKVGPDGEIGFPAAVAIPGGDDLLAMDVVDTDGDGKAEIWLTLAQGKGSKRKRRVVRLGQNSEIAAEVQLAKQKSDPNGMKLFDLDRDGHQDLLIFQPREVPAIWMADGEGDFTDLNASSVPTLGILKGTTLDSMAFGDIDGDGLDEILAPGPNFARAFYLSDGNRVDDQQRPQVVAQFNLDSSAAQVAKLALGDLDGKGNPEVVLYDRAASALTILTHVKGVARKLGEVDLGGIKPTSLLVTDLDGDGHNDLLIAASDRFAVVRNGGRDRSFQPVADLELPIRNAQLGDIGVGDVNGDGEMDVVLLETNRHLVTISAVHSDELEYALRFQVYEERIFERGGRGGREPREVVVSDVTGDGRPDIVVLVHDRVIVYPQE